MGGFPDLCKLSVGVPPVVASDARLKELFKTAKRSKHINQLVRRDTAEWKLPVQTVYRGLEYARFSGSRFNRGNPLRVRSCTPTPSEKASPTGKQATWGKPPRPHCLTGNALPCLGKCRKSVHEVTRKSKK